MRLLAPPVQSTTTPDGAASISERPIVVQLNRLRGVPHAAIKSTQPSNITPPLGATVVMAANEVPLQRLRNSSRIFRLRSPSYGYGGDVELHFDRRRSATEYSEFPTLALRTLCWYFVRDRRWERVTVMRDSLP